MGREPSIGIVSSERGLAWTARRADPRPAPPRHRPTRLRRRRLGREGWRYTERSEPKSHSAGPITLDVAKIYQFLALR